MPLGKGGPVLSQDKGNMGESGRSQSQSLIDHELFGGVGKVVVSPNDMGNSHQRVIHRSDKIISRFPTAADQDKIVDFRMFHRNLSPDDVVEGSGAFLDFQPDGKSLAAL